jgi:beta-glucosidase
MSATKGNTPSPIDLHALVDNMTLEEQVSLLSGEDFWSLPSIERLAIGKLRVTDGPNGARGAGSLVGGVTAAAFPVGISIGSSWDPELAREIGGALAAEVKSKGAHVSLAPTVNIQRSVSNGRNFECYSEDPELTSALAVGFIKGLQENGIAATIKHFAGNESEIERTTINSEIDQRSLREVYIRPFEDAVKKAKTWAIMTSYNKLNGTYTAEHEWLLNDVLRGDWGFDGVVMSDWFGSRSTELTVNAGLDLEMPGPTRDRGAKLVKAVHAGAVTRETLRHRALNILRLIERTGALAASSELQERANDLPEHRALIRRAGAAGTVLLKNDGILPLQKNSKIAVIGPNAKTAQIMGGGSSQLQPHYRVSPWQGLVEKFGERHLTYALGCTNRRWEPLLEGDVSVEFYASEDFSGGVVHRETMHNATTFWMSPFADGKVDPQHFSTRLRATFVAEETGLHRLGLFSAGYSRAYVDGHLVVDAWTDWTKGRTFFEEGCDEIVGEVKLCAGQAHIIEIEFATKAADNIICPAIRVGIGMPLGETDIVEAAQLASESDIAILFVGRSGEWDTEGSDLENITLPGRQDQLISAVLAANPHTIVVLQTGGPIEMPWIDQAPAVLQAWYPGQECGNAIADVLTGDAEPGGRLPQTFPRQWADNPTNSHDPEVYPGKNGKVRYQEGVFIGHRHYERKAITPLFPFGHGLSYSSYSITDVQVLSNSDGVVASLRIKNTGIRHGSTVVQVYVEPPLSSVERPLRELKGFKKVFLDAAETQTITIHLPHRAFAYFDTSACCWRVEEGHYVLSFGFSAVDLVTSSSVELTASRLPV